MRCSRPWATAALTLSARQSRLTVTTDKGVFFTTDKFTGPVVGFARSMKKHIVFIDGPELARLMVRHGVGITVSKTLLLARLDSDYFDSGTEA